MAVLPTPASPTSSGLFLRRRHRIWITLDLVLAADQRVDLAVLGELLVEVDGELLQRRLLASSRPPSAFFPLRCWPLDVWLPADRVLR